jgi:glycosyltransferase involved in cell wall biosynthesis
MTGEETAPGDLPNLVYVGDVPVRATAGSAALLYRLLEHYPREKLQIVETSLTADQPGDRLPGVVYNRLGIGPGRLLRTRLSRAFSTYLYLTAPLQARRVRHRMDGFRPQAVLTIAFLASWRTGTRLADLLRVPLHLVVHDGPPGFFGLSGPLRERADQDFKVVYQHARSRLCISPYMADSYKARYGAPAHTIYPLRASDVPDFAVPAEPAPANLRPFTVAYAGTIYNPTYARAVADTARLVDRMGGRVLVYTDGAGTTTLAGSSMASSAVIREMVSPAELVCQLRRDADLLLVPMSFEADAHNMEVSFPSKLAEYTATGLPILVWGPTYCSAVRWARENGGAAEVVDQQDTNAIAAAIGELVANPAYRRELGSRSLEVGTRLFSHAAVSREFCDILRNGVPARP